MSSQPRRILVPTDFSAASDRAIETARSLANTFSAEIHLLNVHETAFNIHAGEPIVNEVQRVLEPAARKAEDALRQLVDGTDGPMFVPHVEHGVSVADTILDSIPGHGCELVVMGTHGRRPVSGLLMGSVARRVVRLSPAPVVTVHADARGSLPPSKIVVAYDSSDDSLEAVRVARAWAEAFAARVVLLHVVEPVVYPTFYSADAVPVVDLDIIERNCRAALAELVVAQLGGIDAEVAVVRGSAAAGITTYARDSGGDLLVLATRGLSGVSHLLLGSVAAAVVRGSDVPVLTVRGRATAG